MGSISKNIHDGLEILSTWGIEPLDIWCTKYESEEKWSRVHGLLTKFVSEGDWVIHPDADEFHEIPGNSYPNLFKYLDSVDINALQGFLIDRLTENHTVPDTKQILSEDPFKMFPICANMSTLIGLAGVKLMAYKGSMRANNGSGQIHKNFKNSVIYAHGSQSSLHEVPLGIKYLGNSDYMARTHGPQEWTDLVNNPDSTLKKEFPFFVHHFKWHGRVIEKLEERIQTYTVLNRPQRGQSERVLQHYRAHGQFKLESIHNLTT